MKSKILQLLKLKVSDLKEFQGDFKKLSKKQFEKLKLSIQNNGFIQPFHFPSFDFFEKKDIIKENHLVDDEQKFVKVYSFEFVE